MDAGWTRRLIVRADGDTRIGGGHLRRGLALSAAAREAGFGVTLAAASIAPALETHAAQRVDALETRAVTPGSIDDAHWLADVVRTSAASWVVLDGYAFGAEYHRALRAAGCRVLAVDDFGAGGARDADVIVNQNVFAAPKMYGGTMARLLLGPAYALIDPEFGAESVRRPDRSPGRQVVVTLGAADPAGLTLPAVAALLRLPDPRLRVLAIVGGASRLAADELRRLDDARLTVLEDVDRMAPVLAAADLVVTGAGTTVYEACAIGVPIAVMPIADGQRVVAAALGAAGLAHDLSALDPRREPDRFARDIDGLLQDVERREALIRRGRAGVDGHGARRVVRVLIDV